MDKGKVTNQKFTRLTALLKELFQLDQPELDFGLYRVMHARSKEVSEFLEKDLLPQVSAVFEQYKSSDTASIQEELNEAISSAKALGANPDTLPKVQELRAKLDSGSVDVSRLESEVYDHLHTFFRRYYHEGDFLSRRVYKDGVYAIPYSGEEVKLHWANADQYYIKTDEYLKNFTFRLNPGDEKSPLRVHFKIKAAAEGEHGNIKAQENADRRFILCKEDFIAEIDGETGAELAIYFEYRPAELNDWGESEKAGKKSPPAQKDLISIAVKQISGCDSRQIQKWLKPLLAKAPTEKDCERTVFEKHLDRYTKRNTFDYFIHKDLGGFLRRELDFYVKNEVMHLDDVENETAPKVEQYLSKIKAIRKVAFKIIDFLAQLENFQKKLWLKKKFVVETNYCITLDRIPEEFYPEIAANEEQRKEWVKLFAIDEIKGDLVTPGYSEPLTPLFLAANRTLVVDLQNFDSEFGSRLLQACATHESQLVGTLIHSENYQAISLLQSTYRNKIDCLYIDPPYNTDASAILYKNDYKDSSWMSLMENRLRITVPLLHDTGVTCIAIDDEEVANIRQLLDCLFEKKLGIAAIRSNPAGRKTKGKLSPAHEYAIFHGKTNQSIPAGLEITEKRLSRYPEKDEDGNFAWANFIRSGSGDKREDRPTMFYPIYVSPSNSIRVPSMEWNDHTNSYDILEEPLKDEAVVYPILIQNGNRIEKRWQRGYERVSQQPADYRIRRITKDDISIDFKTRMDDEALPTTWWDKKEYASANYGAAELKELFGVKEFDFPKATQLVQDCIRASNANSENATILDYFGGSGTTAHAVLNLNRLDGARRRFIIAELGAHMKNVILPRIKKVLFCAEWSNGKPRPTSARAEAHDCGGMVKIVSLESYEDTLNNLQSKRTDQAQLTLDSKAAQGAGSFKEQYILKYMLDVETKSSQSLLNIQDFKDPTAYKMSIKRPGTDESKLVNVDLIETFNWLLGLTVDHIAAPQTFTATFKRDEEKRLVLGSQLKQTNGGKWWFRTVTGKDTEGRNVLVVWRKRPGGDEPEGIEQDNLVLNEWFRKLGFSTKDREFDLIYVNGTNNLENARTADENWKVRLIEEDFMHLMFDVEEV